MTGRPFEQAHQYLLIIIFQVEYKGPTRFLLYHGLTKSVQPNFVIADLI